MVRTPKKRVHRHQTFQRQRSISFSPTIAARDSFIKHALTARPRKLSEIQISYQNTSIYNNSRYGNYKMTIYEQICKF